MNIYEDEENVKTRKVDKDDKRENVVFKNYISEYERRGMTNVINSFAKAIEQERKSYAEWRREDDYEDLDKDYREYVGIRFWI